MFFIVIHQNRADLISEYAEKEKRLEKRSNEHDEILEATQTNETKIKVLIYRFRIFFL